LDWPLTIGLSLVIIIGVVITCSVIISGLKQQHLLQAVRQQSQKEVVLNKQEEKLLLELKRFWVRDEILPVNHGSYNLILMPDRKLIITLARAVEEAPVSKTGWLVLDLAEEELRQEPEKTVYFIQSYLQNPRVINLQRTGTNTYNNS
jgi:hypothetical protein